MVGGRGWGWGWGVSVWFHTLLLPAGFSVSLPWASGGERGAAGAWVLRQRRTSLINGGREQSEPVNNPEINLDKMSSPPPPALAVVVSNVIIIFGGGGGLQRNSADVLNTGR